MSTYTAYMKVYLAARYQRKRKEALKQLGGKCAKCGSKKRLEFDHIKRSTKTATVTTILCGRDSKLQAELAKCQLLCHDCHARKTARDLRREGFFNHAKMVRNGRKGGRAFAKNLKLRK